MNTKGRRQGLHRLGAILLVGAFSLSIGLMPQLAGANEAGEIFLARGTKLYLDNQFGEAQQQLLQGIQADPENAAIWAQLGIIYLSLKDYPKGKEALTKAVELNPRIPRGKLYLGIAYYNLDNCPEAERLLKEAKAQEPGEGLVHYYLSLCAYRLNRPQEALTELTTGMNQAPQFALGFKSYQQAVEGARPKAWPKFDISFATGIEYDDNVKVLPDTSLINPPGQKQQKGHKADWRVPLILRTEYRPIMNETNILGVRYFAYGGVNTFLDNFNIFDSLAEIYYKYQFRRLTIQPFYAFDHTLLGGQPFSNFHDAGLRLTLQECPHLQGDLIYMFQGRTFYFPNLDGEFKPDGYLNQVGFFQTLFWKKGTLRLGTIWERQVAKGLVWTSQKYRFPLEGTYNLPWRMVAYLYFEYARTNASNADNIFNRHRYEDYYQVVAQVRRPLTSYMDLLVGFTHISQLSNIPDFQYERNIYHLLVNFYY